jgi:hypothetical protein
MSSPNTPHELQPFYDTFNGYFFLTLTGIIVGFATILVKNCYQSKCRNCNLCYGLINIQRDVEGEEKLDIARPRDESRV